MVSYTRERKLIREIGSAPRRIFAIGDYLDNYTLSVDQMMAVDPLPTLIPLDPFPDPYLQGKIRQPEDDPGFIGRWPCSLRENIPPERLFIKEKFPRPRDWMHDWSEYMYTKGDYGARQKK